MQCEAPAGHVSASRTIWYRRTPVTAVSALRERGYTVSFIPAAEDARDIYRAMNFVTLDDGKVLMVEGVPAAIRFLESLHIECVTSPTRELAKSGRQHGMPHQCCRARAKGFSRYRMTGQQLKPVARESAQWEKNPVLDCALLRINDGFQFQ